MRQRVVDQFIVLIEAETLWEWSVHLIWNRRLELLARRKVRLLNRRPNDERFHNFHVKSISFTKTLSREWMRWKAAKKVLNFKLCEAKGSNPLQKSRETKRNTKRPAKKSRKKSESRRFFVPDENDLTKKHVNNTHSAKTRNVSSLLRFGWVSQQQNGARFVCSFKWPQHNSSHR